jgi:hypothetical protein
MPRERRVFHRYFNWLKSTAEAQAPFPAGISGPILPGRATLAHRTQPRSSEASSKMVLAQRRSWVPHGPPGGNYLQQVMAVFLFFPILLGDSVPATLKPAKASFLWRSLR